LQDVCPTRHFTTCDYLAKMPMSENDFLWSREADKSVMGDADRQTRAAIADESGAIVLGTLKAYPLEEARVRLKGLMGELAAWTPLSGIAPLPQDRSYDGVDLVDKVLKNEPAHEALFRLGILADIKRSPPDRAERGRQARRGSRPRSDLPWGIRWS